jgi:membrane-associated phospholipid phosphatase
MKGNMFTRVGFVALGLCLGTGQVMAFTINNQPLTRMQKNIETAGTVVSVGLPLTAGLITIFKHDRKGAVQLLVETGLTVGTVFALKNIVREQRPDGSDYQSFPSDTTALAASGSTFLWRRYGWEYGAPASALTEFVAYSRVQAHQHRWYDTLASSAIAWGYGALVTTRFQRRYHVETELDPMPDGGMVRVGIRW